MTTDGRVARDTRRNGAGLAGPWPRADELLRTARLIAKDVAGPSASDVDARARFPHEALDAMRRARLLGAAVPDAMGGAGSSVVTLGAMCEALAEHCASTGMIYAMHVIQVACIARHHGGSPHFAHYLAEVAQGQTLIASVTSEVGIGGDLRRARLPSRERADASLSGRTRRPSPTATTPTTSS